MIVCLCNNISDKEIQKLVLQGCSTFEDVLDELGKELKCCTCLQNFIESINDNLYK